MPRGDRRGPDGMGPMSGRGRGYCAGYSEPGFVDNGHGRGTGCGRGRGFSGRGRNYFGRGFLGRTPVNQPVYNAAGESEYLKAEAQEIETRLEAITRRLKDIEKNNKDD